MQASVCTVSRNLLNVFSKSRKFATTEGLQIIKMPNIMNSKVHFYIVVFSGLFLTILLIFIRKEPYKIGLLKLVIVFVKEIVSVTLYYLLQPLVSMLNPTE